MSIKQEQTKTVKIYREFFIKAQTDVKKQLEALKSSTFCNNCRKCCKIRYSELSPEEFKKLGSDNFLPLGMNKPTDIVDLKTNQLEAFNVDMEYAQNAISNTDKDCWFYACKFYQNGTCKKGKEKPIYCENYPDNVYDTLHSGCGLKTWQQGALYKLETQIAKDVFEKIQEISKYREEFKCACCGTCCKMASSEFSYEELKEKAKKGDKFAKQFVSVFVPYEDEAEPEKHYKDYIDYLRETLRAGDKVYFYHCPKVKDNLCSDYENRPEICREFPTNPLMILPKCCGYKEWQDETHTTTLLLHALAEIVDFYIKKLKFHTSP